MKRQGKKVRCLLTGISFAMFAAGCATQRVGGDNGPVPSPFAELLAAEIRGTQSTNAYDAVDRLRHEFLTLVPHHTRGALEPEPTIVYVNGTRAGGIDVLKAIPASQVVSIRLVKPKDTIITLGAGLSGGAIIVEVGR